VSVDPTYEALSARAAGSNVDAKTLLATDYLNHLNEPVMLIEMLPDMPDLAEELQAWQPKSYTDHFRDSAVADRDLAIEAYPHAPEEYRLPFEFTIRALNRRVETLREETIDLLEKGEADRARLVVSSGLGRIHALMGVANAIIHGCATREDLASHDCVPTPAADTAKPQQSESEGEPIMSQEEIDSLFD
jgi:hypothetical protein